MRHRVQQYQWHRLYDNTLHWQHRTMCCIYCTLLRTAKIRKNMTANDFFFINHETFLQFNR